MAGAILKAAAILRGGGLVAFPTETVYGLGADATREDAVRGIFEAKGRPATNPLIVHCDSAESARRWAGEWPEAADHLARLFWPGPLTLVVPAGKGIAPTVTANGPTVGLRVPAHPVALALLREARLPIAAPSANRSTGLSPTSAQAVERSLGGRIDAILDGGSCPVGIESTVLSLVDDRPRILRPGMVTARDIEQALGRVIDKTPLVVQGEEPMPSPGLLARHYAPAIPMRMVEAPAVEKTGAFLIRLANEFTREERCICLPREPRSYAGKLYWALHLAEQSGAEEILVECPPFEEEWSAIHDRLRRASSE